MKTVKMIFPYFLSVLIILLGIFTLDYVSNRLLTAQIYSVDNIEKEENFPVYYINNTENFTLYPWNIYEEETLTKLDNLEPVAIKVFIEFFCDCNFTQDISSLDFGYGKDEILFFDKYDIKIALKKDSLVYFENTKNYSNVKYTQAEIDLLLDKINKNIKNLNLFYVNENLRDAFDEKIEDALKYDFESSNADEAILPTPQPNIKPNDYEKNKLQIYFDKINILIKKGVIADSVKSTLISSIEKSNYELFVYKNDVYIIFKDNDTVLSFVYSIFADEIVGFSFKE